MEGSEARNVRRSSVVAQYAAQVSHWLREDPALSAVEILRRVRLAGYRGGKSALYELVRRVRVRRLDDQPEDARQLIIVSGNREDLFNFFQRGFVENETVRVLLDRRVGERRPLRRRRRRHAERGVRR